MLRSLLAAAALAVTTACTPAERAADGAGADRAGGSRTDPAGERSLILATTTSTQDAGLLDSLLPPFERRAGVRVKVIAVGTGAALDMAARGNADVVLVHAPESERRYIASGDLVGGRLVMHNDFLVVGPPDDPAGARRAGGLDAAMRAIARTGPVISRGDNSGTARMELALWTAAGLDTLAVARREQTGQGMGATLTVADQRRGYALTDRATYLALRPRLSLVPVAEGDPRLLNVYHAYVVSPEKHRGVRREAAEALVAHLVAPETQAMIGRFGAARFGQPLFVPDAGRLDPTGIDPTGIDPTGVDPTAPAPAAPGAAAAPPASR